MNFWIKNTEGKPSASLTLVMIAFTVVMSWMVISIFVNPFGIKTVPFNASDAMIVLTPLLGLYFGRRHTDKNSFPMSVVVDDKKLGDKKSKPVSEPENDPDNAVQSENDPDDVQ